MSVDNDTQERLAITQLSMVLARSSSMPCTMDLKRGVLEWSVFQSLAFHLRFAPWTLDCYHKLDELMSRAWHRILIVGENWPTETSVHAQGGGRHRALTALIHSRKLALVARIPAGLSRQDTDVKDPWEKSESLIHHTLGGQLRDGAAPTWISSLVTWLGDKELTPVRPPAEELVYAPDAPAPPVNYRECGLTLQADLGDGGEVPLWAAQWLKPGSTGQKRSVCKLLSFRCEEGGDRAVLLTWERQGNHTLQVGDVVRAHERGTGSTTVYLCHSTLVDYS